MSARPSNAEEERPALGARRVSAREVRFCVWAPRAAGVTLHLVSDGERLIAMRKDAAGYHHATLREAPGTIDYFYRLDGGPDRPDPASRAQPQGVHGPSRVADLDFAWTDNGFRNPPLKDQVFYELHVGTFSREGSFAGVIPHLDRLRDLGVTAIELMPIAAFAGARNWGYDGVFPYAAHEAYGGARGLMQLVDAAHAHGLAVVLDVVYNHLGPEGNYLGDFGAYFTDRYKTPWGPAINFDGEESDHVRRYFVDNALMWTRDFHLDGLRLDAVHAIFDRSAISIFEEIATAVRREARGRHVMVIGESDLNDPRLVTPVERGGDGLDAQWSDDYHHALHALLTGERAAYYQDFGALDHLAKAMREGYVYTGEYAPSRRRRHGRPARHLPPERLVVFAQNHDQVGNRMRGERLSALVGFEKLKLAAAAVCLAPALPLLFMGEEYGETRPFLYFVSHTDPALLAAVREGRKAEFAAFAREAEAPDPGAEATFAASTLSHAYSTDPRAEMLVAFYHELLRLRRDFLRLSQEKPANVREDAAAMTIVLERPGGVCVFNFGDKAARVPVPDALTLALDSADARWREPGQSPAPTRGDATRARPQTHDGAVYAVAPQACLVLTRREAPRVAKR